MKNSNFRYNRSIFQPGMKIWYCARANSLFIFKKLNIGTSQARFKWTNDQRLQEFESSMEFRNCDSNADKVKLYGNVRKSLNRYTWSKRSR